MGLLKRGSSWVSLPMERDKREKIPNKYPKELLHVDSKECYPPVQYRNTDALKAWLIKGRRGWRKDHMTVILRVVNSKDVRLRYSRKHIFGVGAKEEKIYAYAGFLWTEIIDAAFISRKDEEELMENQGKHNVESIVTFLEKVAKYIAWDVFSGSGYCGSWLLVKDKRRLLIKWGREGREGFGVSAYRRTAFISLVPDERCGRIIAKTLNWAKRKAKKLDVDEIHDEEIKVY